ncbi:universal stress protein [Stenomitos frigidus]|uniref:universal stress protein n=1 Tax=Stenomitos frigidus TaxID=1886765 RepID=UPI0011B231C1|nr:universal stress protein [Stenomitos frigidus]
MTQTTAPVLFSPFLLATDGSPSAQLAQTLLAMIAQSVQAQQNGNGRALVTVLTVQPHRSSRSRQPPPKQASVANRLPDANQETPPIAVDGAPETLATATPIPTADDLAKTMQTSFPANLPLTVQVRQGRPAIEILHCARTLQAGLIAVGSRGTSGMRGRLMGSVSAVIARYAPCSVLVARGTAVAAASPSLQHLLLVVNDSPATRQAIAITQQLLPAGVKKVTILYPQQPLNADYLFGPFATPTPSWQLTQSLQEAQREQSETILDDAKAAFSTLDVEVQTLRQTGEPGPLICQVALQQQANLIVLGGNTMRRWLPLPAGERRFSLQSFRRSKPIETELVKQPPVLRNTRLSATEDYTLHHAPCPILLCRAAQAVAN